MPQIWVLILGSKIPAWVPDRIRSAIYEDGKVGESEGKLGDGGVGLRLGFRLRLNTFACLKLGLGERMFLRISLCALNLYSDSGIQARQTHRLSPLKPRSSTFPGLLALPEP